MSVSPTRVCLLFCVRVFVPFAQRDTKPTIEQKKYEFPTAFARTRGYRHILESDKDDWDREGAFHLSEVVVLDRKNVLFVRCDGCGTRPLALVLRKRCLQRRLARAPCCPGRTSILALAVRLHDATQTCPWLLPYEVAHVLMASLSCRSERSPSPALPRSILSPCSFFCLLSCLLSSVQRVSSRLIACYPCECVNM